ncbi:MAG: response regulator transcription factor [Eubacteriales bacterium]|nr:response regulator transcription factor [Eubacteriales bacterium]
MKKIGILEDDEALGKELAYYLETNGYEARWIAPAEYVEKKESDLIDLLLEENLQMLLLDVGLPGFDGLHVCKEYREKSEVPIIMITSRNTELTELMSITSGADDFVPKPFNPQILVARMESIMKRVYKENKTEDVMTITLENGITFMIELLKARVLCGEEEMGLSKNELQILKILAERQGEVVSRDDIMNALWDNCAFVDDNTLTVNMTRLKSKLESIGVKDAIITKRGMGYQLI